jgi:phosphoesterase RecJ-like protein
MSNWQKIKEYFKKQQEIILLVHEKPDGDCLGSALALGHHLREEGYQPKIFHPEPIPNTYDYLPGHEMIKIYPKKELPAGKPIIAVDCADAGRILYPLPQNTPIINIDHHCSNSFFGDFNLVDASAAATGEMVFTLLKHAPQKISAATATCLYVAILADTGSFSYSNTTSETLQIAAELLAHGADIELIRYNFFDRRPLVELLTIKHALTNLQFSAQNKIAWSALSYQELVAHNLLNTDTDSVLNLMRSVEGVEAAVVFRELEPFKIKISFRSQKHLNVNLLANEFGGGGHCRAAGCSIEGNLAEITTKVINRAEEYLKKCSDESGDSSERGH